MLQTHSLIDAFITLFKSLPKEAREEIKRELAVIEKNKTGSKRKISSLKGKVSKTDSGEIDKKLNSLRSQWQRNF